MHHIFGLNLIETLFNLVNTYRFSLHLSFYDRIVFPFTYEKNCDIIHEVIFILDVIVNSKSLNT